MVRLLSRALFGTVFLMIWLTFRKNPLKKKMAAEKINIVGGGGVFGVGVFFLTYDFFYTFISYIWPMWLCNSVEIFFFLAQSHKRPFFKMADQKDYGHNNLWTVGWTAVKIARMVLQVFVMIWLKTKWLPLPFKKNDWHDGVGWGGGQYFLIIICIYWSGHGLSWKYPTGMLLMFSCWTVTSSFTLCCRLCYLKYTLLK